MAFPGWFENLLHSGTAAGLSGIPALQLSSAPDRDWFLRFLRVHYTTRSLSLWPERMWSPKAGARDGTGLRSHIESVASGGVISASQVLVVLSKAELEEAVAKHGPGWILQEERRLTGLVRSLLEERKVRVAAGLDELSVRLVKDGDRSLGSRPLNLLPGEFVTAILPNRHLGDESQVLGVYVHVPGAWEGFRPVAAVTEKQLLYTFGNHWLDNFQHSSLPEGALYQLSRDGAARWIHSIHPDHRRNYTLKRTPQEGAMDVVSLVRRDGRGLIDVQLVPLGRTLDGLNRASTVVSEISDPSPDGLVSLRETGLLLQRVHFPQVMRGYDVYITQDGSMTTSASSPLAVIEVRGEQAALSSRSDQVKLNESLLPPNSSRTLHGQCEMGGGSSSALPGSEWGGRCRVALRWRDPSDGLEVAPSSRWPLHHRTIHVGLGEAAGCRRQQKCSLGRRNQQCQCRLADRYLCSQGFLHGLHYGGLGACCCGSARRGRGGKPGQALLGVRPKRQLRDCPSPEKEGGTPSSRASGGG